MATSVFPRKASVSTAKAFVSTEKASVFTEKVSVFTGKASVSTLLRSTYLVNMLSCLMLYSSLSAFDAICNHKSHQMHACNEELQTKDMTY